MERRIQLQTRGSRDPGAGYAAFPDPCLRLDRYRGQLYSLDMPVTRPYPQIVLIAYITRPDTANSCWLSRVEAEKASVSLYYIIIQYFSS
jgi:hypothetical protein